MHCQGAAAGNTVHYHVGMYDFVYILTIFLFHLIYIDSLMYCNASDYMITLRKFIIAVI